MFRTVLLFIIRSLFTVHSAIVYVTQICRQLSNTSCMLSRAQTCVIQANVLLFRFSQNNPQSDIQPNLQFYLHVETINLACPTGLLRTKYGLNYSYCFYDRNYKVCHKRWIYTLQNKWALQEECAEFASY